MIEPSLIDRAVFPIRAVIYLRPLKFLDFLTRTLGEAATVLCFWATLHLLTHRGVRPLIARIPNEKSS